MIHFSSADRRLEFKATIGVDGRVDARVDDVSAIDGSSTDPGAVPSQPPVTVPTAQP